MKDASATPNPDLEILTHPSLPCLYKRCINPSRYDLYEEVFRREYSHMKQLQSRMARAGESDLYARLFPAYHKAERDSHGQPYICMDLLSGRTLEEVLSSADYREPGPHQLLDGKDILHIFDQLRIALGWLYRDGIVQFDLLPQNIVVRDEKTFDVSLIDFTDCYYPFLKGAPRGRYNRVDFRVNPALPLSVQMETTCALLFTRLFYNGNCFYKTDFCLDPLKPEGRRTVEFFQRQYGQVIGCLLYSPAGDASDNPLDGFDIWYRHLRRALADH